MLSFIKQIKNWLHRRLWSPKRYRHLFLAIEANKARRIMEIGTWNGKRALQMIKTAQKFHSAQEIEYYGFDLFEQMTSKVFSEELSKQPPKQEEVKKLLTDSGAQIKLFQGFTKDTLPRLLSELPKMDFIFIDGGHAIETIQNDWDCASQLMHDQAIVIFDDYYEDRDDIGCKPVVEKIDPEAYQVEILKPQDQFPKSWGMLKINFVKVTKKS